MHTSHIISDVIPGIPCSFRSFNIILLHPSDHVIADQTPTYGQVMSFTTSTNYGGLP